MVKTTPQHGGAPPRKRFGGKRLARPLAVCFCAAVFLFSIGSLAAQEQSALEYPPFSVKAPDGWTVAFSEGRSGVGQTLTMRSPDRAAVFSLTIENIPQGGWAKMIDRMGLRPLPDHGPPNIQDDNTFIITFNDTSMGATGRKIYTRLPDGRRYLLQTALGFHPDLPGLIGAVEIVEIEEKPES